MKLFRIKNVDGAKVLHFFSLIMDSPADLDKKTQVIRTPSEW